MYEKEEGLQHMEKDSMGGSGRLLDRVMAMERLIKQGKGNLGTGR